VPAGRKIGARKGNNILPDPAARRVSDIFAGRVIFGKTYAI
jgi:hypothetical protein